MQPGPPPPPPPSTQQDGSARAYQQPYDSTDRHASWLPHAGVGGCSTQHTHQCVQHAAFPSLCGMHDAPLLPSASSSDMCVSLSTCLLPVAPSQAAPAAAATSPCSHTTPTHSTCTRLPRLQAPSVCQSATSRSTRAPKRWQAPSGGHSTCRCGARRAAARCRTAAHTLQHNPPHSSAAHPGQAHTSQHSSRHQHPRLSHHHPAPSAHPLCLTSPSY